MASTIKDALMGLKPTERSALEYAFEHELDYYVVDEQGNYVGVNLPEKRIFQQELKVGAWSIGKLMRHHATA